MPLYAPPPTRIEVPPGIDHFAFFAALLGQVAPPPVKGNRRRFAPPLAENVPCDAPEWMWWCFYAAAREMVGRRTPHLLDLWDLRSGQLVAALVNAPEDWEEEVDNTGLDALKDLLTIMSNPEAAKLGLKGTTFVRIYEDARKAFAHCKRLRERLGNRGRYESMHRTPRIPIPRTSLPTDSPAFYHLALRETLGTAEESRTTFQGEPFHAEHIKDHHLKKCLQEWKRPGEAALNLLAAITGNAVPSIRKVLSERRTAAKARLTRHPPQPR